LNIAKQQNPDVPVDKDLAYMLLYLQQRVLTLIASHSTNKDSFKICNIDNDQLCEFEERFNMAIFGVISGNLLPETSFDLANPLIENANYKPFMQDF
jgi:hypothetical protein